MSIVRVRDVFQETLDILVKKNKESVKDPASLLEWLLLDYINKHSLPNTVFCGATTQSPELMLAKKFLGLLNPFKYAGYLTTTVHGHFKKTKIEEKKNPFLERAPDSNLRYFIGHLNLHSKTKKLPVHLQELLGAFFCFYEIYRPLLSQQLLATFKFHDQWDRLISGRLVPVMGMLSEVGEAVVLNYLEELKDYHEWIPVCQRMEFGKLLSQLLTGYLPNHQGSNVQLRAPLYKTLVSLINWIPPLHRDEMIAVIISDLRNNHFCLDAATTMVSLRDWVPPEKLAVEIRHILTSIQDLPPDQAVVACDVLRRLLPIIASDLFIEIIAGVMSAHKRTSLGLKAKTLYLLGDITEQRQEVTTVEMENLVLINIGNEDGGIHTAACYAFGRIKKLKPAVMYSCVSIKLYKVMTDNSQAPLLRAVCLASLQQSEVVCCESVRKSYITDLTEIIINAQLHETVRLAAVTALSKMHMQCDINTSIAAIRLFVTMIVNHNEHLSIRLESVAVLGEFKMVYSGEILGEILPALVQGIDNGNDFDLMLALCRFLRKVRNYISDGALGELVQAQFKDLESPQTLIKISACKMLSLLSLLVNDQLGNAIMGRLIPCLEDHDILVRKGACKALESYLAFMGYEQTLHLLSLLRHLPVEHHNNVLLMRAYSHYRDELSDSLLRRLPQEGNDSLHKDESNCIRQLYF